MISQKRLPALRRRLGDFKPEHQQLAVDPGCAPGLIFGIGIRGHAKLRNVILRDAAQELT